MNENNSDDRVGERTWLNLTLSKRQVEELNRVRLEEFPTVIQGPFKVDQDLIYLTANGAMTSTNFDNLVEHVFPIGRAVDAEPNLGVTTPNRRIVTDANGNVLVGPRGAEVSVLLPHLRASVRAEVSRPVQMPRSTLWIIDVLIGRGELTDDDQEGMVGDYCGWYLDRVKLYGRVRATMWLWSHALRLAMHKLHLSPLLDAAAKIIGVTKAAKDLFSP